MVVGGEGYAVGNMFIFFSGDLNAVSPPSVTQVVGGEEGSVVGNMIILFAAMATIVKVCVLGEGGGDGERDGECEGR